MRYCHDVYFSLLKQHGSNILRQFSQILLDNSYDPILYKGVPKGSQGWYISLVWLSARTYLYSQNLIEKKKGFD